jgi:FixJ family two-component response regulator
MTLAGAPTMFVIDDDAAVRASIQGLPRSVGLRSESFAAAQGSYAARVGRAKAPVQEL